MNALVDDGRPFTPPVALSIAGSDSSGGAGIAADLKTFAAHNVFGTFALTAVTAQNTVEVTCIECLSPELVHAQIDAVFADFSVSSAKTGMLGTVQIIESLVERAARGGLPSLVVDPVMVATSGAVLVTGAARAAYLELVSYAAVVTPNLDEAAVLTGRTVTTLAEMHDAARALCDLGVGVAVVKGGHLLGPDAIDVVCSGGATGEITAPMLKSENVHGTGCTLSAAIAAQLALGSLPLEAIEHAKAYVTATIDAAMSWRLGRGRGPLDHFPMTRL